MRARNRSLNDALRCCCFTSSGGLVSPFSDYKRVKSAGLAEKVTAASHMFDDARYLEDR